MRKERDDACDIIIGMDVQLTMNNVQWAGTRGGEVGRWAGIGTISI